jgi:hypothetical protein
VERDAEFTDLLATELFALDLERLTTAVVTATITRAIVRMARARGWQARTEARVEVPTSLSGRLAQQLGFVDVLVSRGRPFRDVAIEIDSTDKPWSVLKLQHVAAAGMHAIWVRWGDEAWAGVYDDIDVIQLPAVRRSRTRPSTAQLTVWHAEVARGGGS